MIKMWVCNNCGSTEKFKGYRKFTEWGTEGIVVSSDGEIEDYHDHDVDDSEINETHIEQCSSCDSHDISNLDEVELRDWKVLHFTDGKFLKKKEKTLTSTDKLRLLADELLGDKISIQEYRQRKTEIIKVDDNGQ